MSLIYLNINAWFILFIAAFNNCLGSLLLKKSRLVASDPSLLKLITSPWFLAGLGVYGVNVILFTKALEKLPVSQAYPVLAGLGFGLIALASHYFFGERFAFQQWVGLGLILCGIVIISR
jgi:multidrug transporter EmrE-like cation transporter